GSSLRSIVETLCLAIATSVIRTESKRIRIRERIPIRKPVQIQPTRDPDWVFLLELTRVGVVVAVPAVELPALVERVLEQAPNPIALAWSLPVQVCSHLRGRPLHVDAIRMTPRAFRCAANERPPLVLASPVVIGYDERGPHGIAEVVAIDSERLVDLPAMEIRDPPVLPPCTKRRLELIT